MLISTKFCTAFSAALHRILFFAMISENTLQVKGSLAQVPFAELLLEMGAAELEGSLRLSFGGRKSIVYIQRGRVVFAVSNQKAHRLVNVLQTGGKLDKSILAQIADTYNDIAFGTELVDRKVCSRRDLTEHTVTQITQILNDALGWPEGDWLFSPLARIKEEMVYDVPTNGYLVEMARCVPSASISARFGDPDELFTTASSPDESVALQMHESYVLSIFAGMDMTLSQIKGLCSLPESGLYSSLYTLWFAGRVLRPNRLPAFDTSKIDQIKSAAISVKKPLAASAALAPEKNAQKPPPEISLEEYLERVESAETAYDVLGVHEKDPLSEIKSSYFSMAKLFHPDKFHRAGTDVLRRVQNAFTQLSQSYEQVKTPDARATYDFKVRKELEMREARRAEGVPDIADNADGNEKAGAENFEIGLDHLTEARYAEAATHLARAVNHCPENALYHAYYGQVLSFSSKFRHKAEAEMQAGIKLDPQNWKIRQMLVDFFLDMDMAKRAEGELRRFLETVPGHAEAAAMLRTI